MAVSMLFSGFCLGLAAWANTERRIARRRHQNERASHQADLNLPTSTPLADAMRDVTRERVA